MKHRHDWELTDAGFVRHIYMGTPTRNVRAAVTAGVRCRAPRCGTTRRMPFEKAACLPMAPLSLSDEFWVQVANIDEDAPPFGQPRLVGLSVSWRDPGGPLQASGDRA